jgi:hypothetical protein
MINLYHAIDSVKKAVWGTISYKGIWNAWIVFVFNLFVIIFKGAKTSGCFVRTQTELLKINAPELTLKGEWLDKSIPTWEGTIEFTEPLFSISFLQYGESVHWVKSDNEKSNGHRIWIKLFCDDKLSRDVQFAFNFNNSVGRIWTKVESLNDRPTIHSKCIVGHICLIAHMKGEPEIKLHALFIPRSLTKVGRNGLWHVKDELLDNVDNDYKKILRYGRAGAFIVAENLLR